MAPPDRQQITVATDALRSESTEWDSQSGALGTIVRQVSGLGLGRVEAGLFQMIVSAYNDVVNHVTERCREGQAATMQIALTLRAVADTYDQEDRNSEHRLRNIY